MIADDSGVLLGLLAVDHFQCGEPLRHRNRVAAVSVEVDAVGCRLCQLCASRDRAERSAVAGRRGEGGGDRLPRQRRGRDGLRRELAEHRLLLAGGGRVDARVRRFAVLLGEPAVEHRRRGAGDRGDLGGEEAQDDAVLVGGPHRAVALQEARARALLAAERHRAVEQPEIECHGRQPGPRLTPVLGTGERGQSVVQHAVQQVEDSRHAQDAQVGHEVVRGQDRAPAFDRSETDGSG